MPGNFCVSIWSTQLQHLKWVSTEEKKWKGNNIFELPNYHTRISSFTAARLEIIEVMCNINSYRIENKIHI